MPIDERRLLGRGTLSSALEVALQVVRAGFGSWDRIAIGYRDPRYALLSGAARSAFKVRFNPRAGVYHSDAYFALLGGDPTTLASQPLHPCELLAAAKELGKSGVVLAPGGARNILRDDALRRYPIEHYVSLARMALDQGKPITIMGAHSDEWVRSHFADLPVRLELGTVALEDIPHLLRQFERLITHDSGPMHLGFMSGIPVTALFGPTRADEKVPHNYSANGSIVIQGGKELSCAPCYDGRNYADCSHQACLRELSPHADWIGGRS
jgi:heptosyltransferase-2